MLAYWHLVSVRAFLAKARGLPFCRSAAPRPTCEALTCVVTGSEVSKYLRVVSLMTASLTCSKVASQVQFQMKSVSFLSSLCRGAVKVDKPGMKELRYMTRPKNSWSLVMFVGAGKACTASTFPGSGWTPLAL